MRTFGIWMNGFENVIEYVLKTTASKFGRIDYLEIGIGFGETLGSCASIIKDSVAEWSIFGVDVEDGIEKKKDRILSNLNGFDVDFGCKRHSGPSDGVVVISTSGSPKAVDLISQSVLVALIDGCHCKACAKRDFESVERLLPSGAICMFHDASKVQSGSQAQPCGGIFDVYGAISELGLLSGSRSGWKSGVMLDGDHSAGCMAGMFLCEKL